LLSVVVALYATSVVVIVLAAGGIPLFQIEIPYQGVAIQGRGIQRVGGIQQVGTRIDQAQAQQAVSPTAHREAETAKAHRG